MRQKVLVLPRIAQFEILRHTQNAVTDSIKARM